MCVSYWKKVWSSIRLHVFKVYWASNYVFMYPSFSKTADLLLFNNNGQFAFSNRDSSNRITVDHFSAQIHFRRPMSWRVKASNSIYLRPFAYFQSSAEVSIDATRSLTYIPPIFPTWYLYFRLLWITSLKPFSDIDLFSGWTAVHYMIPSRSQIIISRFVSKHLCPNKFGVNQRQLREKLSLLVMLSL